MMDGQKDVADKRQDQPPEEPKNLPSIFPNKFDTEKTEATGKKKRGKGARLHGSM